MSNKFLLFEATQSVVFHYNSPNGLGKLPLLSAVCLNMVFVRQWYELPRWRLMYIKKSISVRYLSIRTHASLNFFFLFLKLTVTATIILGYCFCLAGKLCLTLFVAPWTVTCQAPISMGFPRQEYWVGCHFVLRGIFLTQESNPRFLPWQADSLPLSHQGSPTVLGGFY